MTTTIVRVQPRDLIEPLAVSHTVVRTVDRLWVEVTGPASVVGLGEVTVGPWDATSTADVLAAVEAMTSDLGEEFPADAGGVRQLLTPRYGLVPPAATLVVEMALLDSLSRAARVPFWAYVGLPAPADLPLFTTVDLDATQLPWTTSPGRYKVKLGGSRDDEVLASCSRASDSTFLFDVNSGWDLPTYLRRERALAACRPLGVEDPVHDIGDLLAERATWRQRRIVLDESVRSVEDVRSYAGQVAGVNLKLLKFGGLLPAMDAARIARSAGAQVMIGCFVEPARCIAYAAGLTGLADVVDLDGERWLTGVVRDGDLLGPGPGLEVPR